MYCIYDILRYNTYTLTKNCKNAEWWSRGKLNVEDLTLALAQCLFTRQLTEQNLSVSCASIPSVVASPLCHLDIGDMEDSAFKAAGNCIEHAIIYSDLGWKSFQKWNIDHDWVPTKSTTVIESKYPILFWHWPRLSNGSGNSSGHNHHIEQFDQFSYFFPSRNHRSNTSTSRKEMNMQKPGKNQ